LKQEGERKYPLKNDDQVKHTPDFLLLFFFSFEKNNNNISKSKRVVEQI
jgi:hypothetical protein